MPFFSWLPRVGRSRRLYRRRASLPDPAALVSRTLLSSCVRRDRASDAGCGPERKRREGTAGPARIAAAGMSNAGSSWSRGRSSSIDSTRWITVFFGSLRRSAVGGLHFASHSPRSVARLPQMRLSATLAALLLASAVSAQADVVGTARVIDGDTIVVDGEHVRLRGIDAPETNQTCTAYGQQWACGRMAAQWLTEYLRGRQVDCVGHARDRYGRLLAVCYAGGEDINERLVREDERSTTASTRSTISRRKPKPNARVRDCGVASSCPLGSGGASAAETGGPRHRAAHRAAPRAFARYKRSRVVVLREFGELEEGWPRPQRPRPGHRSRASESRDQAAATTTKRICARSLLATIEST